MQDIITKEGFGFGFDPTACASCEGNCCIGESGYVWVNKDELRSIAEFLDLNIDDFNDKHIRKIRFKNSLKEIRVDDKNYICEFFDIATKRCQIYEVRPTQCRTFPFWEHFINNIKEVKKECPGILHLS